MLQAGLSIEGGAADIGSGTPLIKEVSVSRRAAELASLVQSFAVWLICS